MNKGQKTAILLDLSKQLFARGSWCGETHLQKAMYFLQSLFEIDTDFEFVLYRHGPFSFGLRDALNEMTSDGFLELVARYPGYGPSLLPAAEAQELLRRFPKTLEKHRAEIRFVADSIGDKGVGELERVSTAIFLISRYPGMQDNELADKLVELKPHIHTKEALKAFEEAHQLLEDAPCRQAT